RPTIGIRKGQAVRICQRQIFSGALSARLLRLRRRRRVQGRRPPILRSLPPEPLEISRPGERAGFSAVGPQGLRLEERQEERGRTVRQVRRSQPVWHMAGQKRWLSRPVRGRKKIYGRESRCARLDGNIR